MKIEGGVIGNRKNHWICGVLVIPGTEDDRWVSQANSLFHQSFIPTYWPSRWKITQNVIFFYSLGRDKSLETWFLGQYWPLTGWVTLGEASLSEPKTHSSVALLHCLSCVLFASLAEAFYFPPSRDQRCLSTPSSFVTRYDICLRG